MKYEQRPVEKESVKHLTDALMICINSKDADLVHVRELSNHEHKNSEGVEEEHRMLVVCRVRGNQIPAKLTKGNIMIN